jgi:two-component system, cell cycle response regulator
MSTTTSEARPTPELAARLRALTVGRLLAGGVVALLLGTIASGLVDPAGARMLVWAGVVYVTTNLLTVAIPPRPWPQRLALDASLLIDAAAVGVVLAVTGGPASPFALLMYAEVVAITLVFGWWSGARVALLLSIALAWVHSTSPPSLQSATDAVTEVDPALATALDPTIRTVMLLLGLWFVAVLVASLSSVTERDLRGLIDDLALLREVNHDLDPRHGLAQVSDGIARTLVDTFGYQRAVVWLSEDEDLVAMGGARLEPAARAELGTRRVAAEAYPLRNAFQESGPWPVRRADPRPGALERMLGVDSPLVLVPLGTEERQLGMVTAEVPRRMGRRPRLRGRDLRLLSMLAGEASLVLDNARLHAELRARAVTDALTGLPNHGFFQQRLSEELDRMARRAAAGEQRVLSVVLFDLDHFKRVNDSFGHQVGDAVLRQAAQATDRMLRSSDVVCRYGGEEFAIVLPDTTAASAVRACERMQTALHQLRVETPDGSRVGPITASFGIASAVGADRDRASLIRAADEALYEAKRRGRDRVVTHPGTAAMLSSGLEA